MNTPSTTVSHVTKNAASKKPYVNKMVEKNLEWMQGCRGNPELKRSFLDYFPVEEGEIRLDRLYSQDAINAMPDPQQKIQDILQQNRALHQAYQEYAALARRENSFYRYVQEHLAEGFSPKEWSIISVLLTTRAMPTSPDLGFHDVVDRNGGMHTPYISPNLGVEVGIDGKPHADLLFDMLRTLKHLPFVATFIGKEDHNPSTHENVRPPIIDNIRSQAMFEQLIRFRREGKLEFPKESLYRYGAHGTQQKLLSGFVRLCEQNGLGLPHDLRKALGKVVDTGSRIGPHIPDHFKTDIQSTEMPLTILSQFEDANGKCFETALACAQLFDGDEILKYGEQTRKNQALLLQHADNPYDIGHRLISGIEVLSRESDSSGDTQVRAGLHLMRAHLGYIDAAKLSGSELKRAKRHALHWGVEHVDESTGVEEDHAKAARNRFKVYAQTCIDMGQEVAAPLLTKAFEFETRQGYLKLQNDHMDYCVGLLEKYRAEAIAHAKNGVNPFIAPKQGAPSWTQTITEGWKKLAANAGQEVA